MAPAVETFASEVAKVQWPAEAQDEARFTDCIRCS